MKKLGLTLKWPNKLNVCRVITTSQENFDQHFDTLKNINKKFFPFKPSNIINMNETSWSKNQQKRRVIGWKGKGETRPMQWQAKIIEHITSVHAVTASGERLLTMIILKSAMPKSSDGDNPESCFKGVLKVVFYILNYISTG